MLLLILWLLIWYNKADDLNYHDKADYLYVYDLLKLHYPNLYHINNSNSKMMNEISVEIKDIPDKNSSTFVDFFSNKWGQKYDGEWEFASLHEGYSVLSDHLGFQHNKGYSTSYISCDSTNNPILKVKTHLELYDGNYRNRLLEFGIEFSSSVEGPDPSSRIVSTNVITVFEVSQFKKNSELFFVSG